jgi:hypothetical protein
MSQNKNRDYSSRNQVLSGRVNFAYQVVRQQQLQDTQVLGYNLAPPDNPTSALTYLSEGVVATTPAEVARYLEELNRPTSQQPSIDTSTVPDAPTDLSVIAGNEHLEISFTQGSNGGSEITNYEYLFTDLSGSTFQPFSPPQTSSPVYVTGLTNGVSYTIALKAVNKNGASVASSSVSGTPTGTETFVPFTSVETTSWTAPTWTTSVQYLVVAGGGGSGGGFDTGAGGGGGAGEVVAGTLSVVGGTTYTVVVGDGGIAGFVDRTAVAPDPKEIQGGTGGTSTFASITAAGGEGGYGSRLPPFNVNGNGGAQVTSGNGGGGGNGGGSNGGGGGGGGNGSAGGNRNTTTAGTGGIGVSNSISGSAVTYGAGGAGGTGSINNDSIAGTNNRGNGAKGGGGGAGSQRQGAKGGTGYVALRFFY